MVCGWGQSSSRSTEVATYYAIDGAYEDGTYILIAGIFGTNDQKFTKKVRRRNGKKTMTMSIRLTPSMNYTSESALPKHAPIGRRRMVLTLT